MGLDMYLERQTYVRNWDHMDPDELTHITIEGGRGGASKIDTSAITYIIEEAGYWRKANAIHAWFVENCGGGVDECQRMYVSIDDLRALRNEVQAVLNGADPEDHLPSRSGFFFGSTAYDEWYREDLLRTVKILDDCLVRDGGDEQGWWSTYYYQASW